jgi:hypothetical protein
MTRDEIIKQMGWPSNANVAISDLVDRVEAAVRKAEEAEREACAKLCEEWGAWNNTAQDVAAAIRARGET